MQLTQREEQFFKAMAGDGSAPVPVSREERFMADIVSGESSGLSPLTAEERALNGLVGKIGGGGDSDFSTAEVTIINNTENVINEQFPCCVEENELGEGSPAAITTTIGGFSPGNTTIKIPLYKGYALLSKFTEASISVGGDITLIGASTLAVSGNGTITLEQQQ